MLPVLVICAYQLPRIGFTSLGRFAQVNAILAVSGNLLLSFSTNSIYGKYIMMMQEAGKTLFRLIFPLALLIGCLATCSFFLRYPTTVEYYLQNRNKDNQTSYNMLREFCFETEPFDPEFVREKFNHWGKAFMGIVNGMYGQTDTKYMTDYYQYMDDYDVMLEATSVLLWAITTMLTTVLFMNILLGLTIGDVRRIVTCSNCYMVQINIHEMRNQAIWDDIFWAFCRCCMRPKKGQSAPTEDTLESMSIFPNKFWEGCALKKDNGCCARFKNRATASYILGCKKARDKIVEAYTRFVPDPEEANLPSEPEDLTTMPIKE